MSGTTSKQKNVHTSIGANVNTVFRGLVGWWFVYVNYMSCSLF